MDLVGGAHPIVVADAESAEGLVEQRAHLVGVGLRLEPLGERGAPDLVAVLVGAAQEPHVFAAQLAPLVAPENIGGKPPLRPPPLPPPPPIQKPRPSPHP